MAITNTYVTSVNGKTGDLPSELDRMVNAGNGEYNPLFGPVPHRHRSILLDADDFPVEGTGGDSIADGIQEIAGTVRPLILEQIEDSNEYIMCLGAGIPYEPTT